ncbi:hypothetical protein TcasGA2_TC033893 [Tribolium castaneum]|uniref:RNA-directed DNA polymerase n=1 Tax=Tribolium castaneum TaxID=7070 RepID=A0A139WE72_TRICA|nr:hypothetical protein TcasGA2_TC033893 [Tribolium castaneum]
MILSNFKTKRDLHGFLVTMINYVPEEGQSLYEYVYKKLALIRKLKLPLTDEDKVNLIMGSIQDQQIKFVVETANIKSPQELANHLRNLQTNARVKTPVASSSFKNKQTTVDSKKYYTQHSQQSMYHRPNNNKSQNRSTEIKSTCFKCGEVGHFQRFCPKNKSTRPGGKLAIEPRHVNFIGNHNQSAKYFKMIQNEKQEIKCFVDFDSQCSLITKAAVKLLELPRISSGTDIVLTTFGDEQKYHSLELEALAVLAPIRRFRQYLGRHFTLITDCSAVKNAFQKNELNARIGRWVLELSEYQFDVVHRSNEQMRHVDALSRNPSGDKLGVFVTLVEDDWLLAVQENDSDIQNIKTILKSGGRKNNKETFINYALKSEKIYKVTSTGLKWVAPKATRFQLLRMAHDDSGHFAFNKTFDLLSNRYWFKGMRKFVRKNKPPKTYVAEKMAERYGHKVLRLPPYHCIFNPIKVGMDMGLQTL